MSLEKDKLRGAISAFTKVIGAATEAGKTPPLAVTPEEEAEGLLPSPAALPSPNATSEPGAFDE